MMYVHYEQAVEAMTKGLSRFMRSENAKHFAEIFAGNSLDGIYSHGMNRYPRYISDMESRHLRLRAQMEETIEFSAQPAADGGEQGRSCPQARALTERTRKPRKRHSRHRGDVGADFAGEKENVQKTAPKF